MFFVNTKFGSVRVLKDRCYFDFEIDIITFYTTNFLTNAFIIPNSCVKPSTYSIKNKNHRENEKINGSITCFGNHSYYKPDEGKTNLGLLKMGVNMNPYDYDKWLLNYKHHYWKKE